MQPYVSRIVAALSLTAALAAPVYAQNKPKDETYKEGNTTCRVETLRDKKVGVTCTTGDPNGYNWDRTSCKEDKFNIQRVVNRNAII